MDEGARVWCGVINEQKKLESMLLFLFLFLFILFFVFIFILFYFFHFEQRRAISPRNDDTRVL